MMAPDRPYIGSRVLQPSIVWHALEIVGPPRLDGDAVLVLGHDQAWTRHAACASVPIEGEPFFPERGDDGSTARAVCATCPVVVDCLLAALDNREEHGIWGGLSELGRRPLARAHARARHVGFVEACGCRFCDLVRDHLEWLDGGDLGGPARTFGEGASHGKASTYSRGCRCTPCRDARTAQQKRRTAARRTEAMAS